MDDRGDEPNLIGGKRGATRLGFAILLRFYTERGRFPRGRSEIPDEAIAYVARQIGVDRTEIAFYDWSGQNNRVPPCPDQSGARVPRMQCGPMPMR
ncbi:DUF4158 domain-containing protein [Nocardia farcinica]|uniref:DUF4158 domain-containing protein n=1 Tax=Nocardia farcinica TaxID=37329 RepID=UPI0010C9390E